MKILRVAMQNEVHSQKADDIAASSSFRLILNEGILVRSNQIMSTILCLILCTHQQPHVLIPLHLDRKKFFYAAQNNSRQLKKTEINGKTDARK